MLNCDIANAHIFCHALFSSDFVKGTDMDSQCKGRNAPSLRSLMLDAKKIRPVDDFLWSQPVL